MSVSLAGKFKAQRDEARAENARLRASGNTVDCRSEEGVVVGLIDATIAQARIVASYLRTGQMTSAIAEALADLRADEDVANCLGRTLGDNTDIGPN